MAIKKNHKESHDNGDVLHKQVQKIIASAIGQVANDYETLFAVAEDSSAAAESLCERHKQGKVILSHLEVLLKINETYIKTPQIEQSTDFKKRLVDTARSNLQEKTSDPV